MAAGTLAEELITAETEKVGYAGPVFTSPAGDVMRHVYDSGRCTRNPTNAAIRYNFWMYEVAEFSAAEGVKPKSLEMEQLRGIIGLQSWVGNGEDRKFTRLLLPEHRLEYLVMMVRRDLLTNEVSNIMGTVLSFIQLHDGNIDAAYSTLENSPQDGFAIEMSANARHWGFPDAYELVEFVGKFDQFANSAIYNLLSRQIREAMPVKSPDSSLNSVMVETFRTSEARKALFTYYYINKLFPGKGTERSKALHRLGIPPHIKAIQLDIAADWRKMNTKDIGAFFSYFNAPLIRFGFFNDWLEYQGNK